MKDLQQMSTLEQHATQPNDSWPKSQHVMLIYDELIQKPYKENASYFRDKRMLGLLIPSRLDKQKFGQALIDVGMEMIGTKRTGVSENDFLVTEDKDEFHEAIFGKKVTKRKREPTKKDD